MKERVADILLVTMTFLRYQRQHIYSILRFSAVQNAVWNK